MDHIKGLPQRYYCFTVIIACISSDSYSEPGISRHELFSVYCLDIPPMAGRGEGAKTQDEARFLSTRLMCNSIQAQSCDNGEWMTLSPPHTLEGGSALESNTCFKTKGQAPLYLQLGIGPHTYDVYEVQWEDKRPKSNAVAYIGSVHMPLAMKAKDSMSDIQEAMGRLKVVSSKDGKITARTVGSSSGHASFLYFMPTAGSAKICNVKVCATRRDVSKDGRPMTVYAFSMDDGSPMTRSVVNASSLTTLRDYPNQYDTSNPDPRGYCKTKGDVLHDTGRDKRCPMVNGKQQLCVKSYEPGLDDCQLSCFFTNEHPCNQEPGHITVSYYSCPGITCHDQPICGICEDKCEAQVISADVTIGTLPKVPGSTSVQQQTITSSTEAVNKGKVAQNLKATFTFNYQAKSSFKFAKKTTESFKAKVSFGIPYTDAKGTH